MLEEDYEIRKRRSITFISQFMKTKTEKRSTNATTKTEKSFPPAARMGRAGYIIMFRLTFRATLFPFQNVDVFLHVNELLFYF